MIVRMKSPLNIWLLLIFLLLLVSVILQTVQNNPWKISHLYGISVNGICGVIADNRANEVTCRKCCHHYKMSEHFWTTFQTVLGGFLAAILGFISGWLLNRWQRVHENKRAIESRRRELIDFLEKA